MPAQDILHHEFDLLAYLGRIAVTFDLKEVSPNLETLRIVQNAHVHSIPFENLDIVQRRLISVEPVDIESKLVNRSRGGYCFETNLVLFMALKALGFNVHCALARVRYMKPVDEMTNYTHLVLVVVLANGTEYLVDVGFGGMAPIVPVEINTETSQHTPDGAFRMVGTNNGCADFTLQWDLKGSWTDLYILRHEKIPLADVDMSNWWSCTHPKAKWVGCLFVARPINGSRHFVLNNEYCIRSPDGSLVTTLIKSRQDLMDILSSVFNIDVKELCFEPDSDANFDRFLTSTST